MEVYNALVTQPRLRAARRKALCERAKEAIAWGTPDNESIGYTQTELCGIIRDLLEELQNNG
jgi:hypothetical protein